MRRAGAKFQLAVYTRDLVRLIRVSEQLEYALVGANDITGYTHAIPPRRPHGIRPRARWSTRGHRRYTEVKSVVVNLG